MENSKVNTLEEDYHQELSKHPLYRLFFPRHIVIFGASIKPKIDIISYIES